MVAGFGRVVSMQEAMGRLVLTGSKTMLIAQAIDCITEKFLKGKSSVTDAM
jgi:hypothetical protein